MSEPFHLRPANCPACNAKMQNKVLVCAACWWKAPTNDRVMFHRVHTRSRGNSEACRGIGIKIIKGLKASSTKAVAAQ